MQKQKIGKFIVKTSDKLWERWIGILNTIYFFMIGIQVFTIVYIPFPKKLEVVIIIGTIGFGILFSVLVYIALGQIFKKIMDQL
ncbi:hypothetical protein K7E08_01985 [Ligilactobacillus salivarius]|uniref:hypothetical protein n=1 Tax=Ligilactobacillus salivarius TaxID=1624 RepID=UPI001CBC82DA|nr:hypothetical protein [Ligilactobacillus salivarius]MBZ4029740.1 hypothetical protein [Ligilactobacillus salivarius]